MFNIKKKKLDEQNLSSLKNAIVFGQK